MTEVSASVPARIHLAGNPSDGYGGAVLSATVEGLAATVRVEPADEVAIRGHPDGESLVRAALDELDHRVDAGSTRRPGRFVWTTTIPRSVGLAGSSAIVIATMRAALRWWGVPDALDPLSLASAALAAEVERLGITAGPADRTVQAIGGVVFTDCRAPRPVVEVVAPHRPVPVLLLWNEDAAAPSGDYHRELRRRLAGAGGSADAIEHLAGLARDAAGAVRAGDVDALAHAADESLRARCALGSVPPAAFAPVEAIRREGAGVNFAGSGGALVVIGDVEPPPGWAARRVVLEPISPAPGPSPSTRPGPSSS